MKKIFTILFLLVFSFCLYAEIKVLSPVSGNWANKQMLFIDTSDGGDYFYSLNGEDPEIAGFAYDGPVLIDMTGNITVKISRGFEEKTEINFSVKPAYPEEDDQRSFVYTFFDTGILNYFAGSEISIPQSFRYSFEEQPESFNPGKKISYSEKCSLSRFLPCTVTDGKLFWHFIIRANPKSTGSFSRRDLPFRIKNWNLIEFEDDNLLFRVDKEFWTLPSESRVLDRSESHVIYWQSLDYSIGNPIEFYELPPLPELKKITNSDGSLSFVLDGDDSYTMTISSGDSPFYELYTELCADTFPGDFLESSINIAVYSDSVYQGILHEEIEIDKRLPSFPVFTSSALGFHARGSVSVNVKTTGESSLYLAVSDPLILENSDYSADSEIFKSINPENFSKVDRNTDFILQSNMDKPVYYKVRAYSESGTNRSDISEYAVIIDSYSFFFDDKADPVIADGSKDHPFTTFQQAYPLMKNLRSINIFVKGNLLMPEGKTEIGFNCDIKGIDNAVIQFPENSYLILRSSTLQISDCRLINDSAKSRSASSLLKIENSVFALNNCEVYFAGGRNAAFVDGQNSVIMLTDSAATVTAQVYASFLSAINSRITNKNCRVAVVADTAICFSLRDSKADIGNSSFRVTGSLGRIAEFFNSDGNLQNNTFSADLKRSSGAVKPLYYDEQSKVTDKNNRVQGF